MSTFFQTTFRSNFIAGFDKYVERGAFGDPVPDVYWDPKDGRWETYLPSQWRKVDQNLPSVGKIDFLTNAGAVFDQITQQWAGLSPEHRQSAAWDGGRHKWVLAEFINRTGQSCREAYEKQLRYLRGFTLKGSSRMSSSTSRLKIFGSVIATVCSACLSHAYNVPS